jgi:hypothetical protein
MLALSAADQASGVAFHVHIGQTASSSVDLANKTSSPRLLEFAVRSITGILGFDRPADSQLDHVEEPISRAGGIEPATGVEV